VHTRVKEKKGKKMGNSQDLNNASARAILELAHIGFLPTLVYLGIRKQWWMFTYVLYAVLNSMLMHLCQDNVGYGLYNGKCLIGEGDDVGTGFSLGDYMTAYGFVVAVSVYGPDVPLTQQIVMIISIFEFNSIFISVYAPSMTAPLIINILFAVGNILVRALLIWQKGESLKYYNDYINLPSLITGVLLLVVAGICYLLQSDDNYIWLHSAWMFLAGLGSFFILHAFEKPSVWETIIHCCREPQTVERDTRDPVARLFLLPKSGALKRVEYPTRPPDEMESIPDVNPSRLFRSFNHLETFDTDT